MSESDLYKDLVKNLGEVFKFRRVEDKMKKGFADCVWVHKIQHTMGLLELKYVPNTSGSLRVPLRQEQIIEAYEWAEFTFSVGVLCRWQDGPTMYFPALHTVEWVKRMSNPMSDENVHKLMAIVWEYKIDWKVLEKKMLWG